MITKENIMRRNLYLLFLAAIFACAAPGARADSLTFVLIPPDVSGPAGTTVGWGFSITNTSSKDYLDLSGIDSDLFASVNGTSDASIFPFPNLAPGQTATQIYDPVLGLGLFQFIWNFGVATGTSETGEFRLLGAFCDPTVDQFCAEDGSVTSTALASAEYSATVTPPIGTPISEPSTFLILLSGLIATAWWICRSQTFSSLRLGRQ
jgi:hypothetical protein